MEFWKYTEVEEFEKGLSLLGIELSDNQKQQFFDYYELLIEWNKVMNLTAITELSEIIHKHFIDSLSLVRDFKLSKEKVLDMGTGAGFPGIPLKIVFPDIKITLLDSLNKRIKFLNEVIHSLGIQDIEAIHGRAEEYGKNPSYREQYDLCVSRAVAKLSTLSEYCLPFVKKGGLFIPYKSGKIEDEVNLSEKALKILGGKIEKTDEFLLPGTEIERTLIMIRKSSITPNKYPRSSGKPVRDPL